MIEKNEIIEVKVVKISEIKPNPSNPRLIKDDKFKKLVASIEKFPQMSKVRALVVNTDMVIIGGNMRYKAMKEVGWKEVPVQIVNWTEEEQKEFIIKDNASFGEWAWDDLANNWDSEELTDWGLDIPNFDNNVNLDEFFEQNNIDDKLPTGKIILEFTIEECDRVKAELLKHGNTPEESIYNLLGL